MFNGTKEAKLTIRWSLRTGLIKESPLTNESTSDLRLRVPVPWTRGGAQQVSSVLATKARGCSDGKQKN